MRQDQTRIQAPGGVTRYVRRVSRLQQLSHELWVSIEDDEYLRRGAERVLEEANALIEDLNAAKRARVDVPFTLRKES